MKYFILLFRSLISYIYIAFIYRIMGKREIGELSVMDLIVSIFIANIASICIEDINKNMLMSIIPITVLVLLQIIISYLSLKNTKVRRIIDGKPSIIINRGEVCFKEMKKQRYNIEDLLTQLRKYSVKSIEEVDYAILETSGELSIFKKDNNNRDYPLPLIIDGIVDKDTLLQINKDNTWLINELDKINSKIDNIFYGFYKNNNLYIIEKDKIK